MSVTATDYDEVPYPSYVHAQTHPDRLAVIAALFGLPAAPVKKCRVLELGCGDGANLAPMAYCLPESTFVGLDRAHQPIAKAKEMARATNLTNLNFHEADLADESAVSGQFDYIIAHGIYSWVPLEIRDALLALCRRVLSPNGIAFISYNALPGSRLRNMVREMMLFHVRGITGAPERTRQALAFADFLADAQGTQDASQLWMKSELQHILKHAPGHLHHDELSPINEPMYFTQFMEHAAQQDLQYLGEADFFDMSDRKYPLGVRNSLEKLRGNRVLHEQYLDFLACRSFRQTLLCPAGAQVQAQPRSEAVSHFLIACSVAGAPEPPDLTPGVKVVFTNAKGGKGETDLPLGKAALATLQAAWPERLPFAALFAKTLDRLSSAGFITEAAAATEPELREFLLKLYAGNLIQFHTTSPPVALTPGEKPVAHPLARWQTTQGDVVSSLFHVAVQVEDEVGKNLLTWLDGTQDHASLLEKLLAFLKSRNALVVTGGDEQKAHRELAIQLEENLAKLARMGLLIR